MPLHEFVFARNTTFHDWIWAGGYSQCHLSGSILRTAKQIIAGVDAPVTFVVPSTDGLVNSPVPPLSMWIPADLEAADKAPHTVVGILCTRGVQDRRLVLLPLDDESFDSGVINTVSRRVALPEWESRQPIAYWRGCMSGGYAPTPRTRLVALFRGYPHADIKMTQIHRALMSPEFQGDLTDPQDTCVYDVERGLEEHLKHKYIFIVDGNCIASAHQWVFASGSVPIMITHPDNDWWFRKFLKPMVHYVPVNYDLSDAREKIEWLVANDDKAKEIANNALEFARTVLSSEFQHGYLLKEIKRAAGV